MPLFDNLQHSTGDESTAQKIRNERLLVGRLLAGNREAWTEFVDQYQRVVFARVNHVLSLCSNPVQSNDPEDVVADLFASLLANDMRLLRKFQHRSTLATWLTIVAHRMSLRAATRSNRARANQSEPNGMSPRGWISSASGSIDQLPDDPSENPLAQLLRLESRAKIRRKLAMLKPADRQVIELYHFENLQYREIAIRMGLSENSVGPRLTRAQRRLKRLVEEAR